MFFEDSESFDQHLHTRLVDKLKKKQNLEGTLRYNEECY